MGVLEILSNLISSQWANFKQIDEGFLNGKKVRYGEGISRNIHNELVGRGMVLFENGDRYEGDIVNGMIQGKGIFTRPSKPNADGTQIYDIVKSNKWSYDNIRGRAIAGGKSSLELGALKETGGGGSMMVPKSATSLTIEPLEGDKSANGNIVTSGTLNVGGVKSSFTGKVIRSAPTSDIKVEPMSRWWDQHHGDKGPLTATVNGKPVLETNQGEIVVNSNGGNKKTAFTLNPRHGKANAMDLQIVGENANAKKVSVDVDGTIHATELETSDGRQASGTFDSDLNPKEAVVVDPDKGTAMARWVAKDGTPKQATVTDDKPERFLKEGLETAIVDIKQQSERGVALPKGFDAAQHERDLEDAARKSRQAARRARLGNDQADKVHTATAPGSAGYGERLAVRQQVIQDRFQKTMEKVGDRMGGNALVPSGKNVDAMNAETEAAVSASREKARATARAVQKARQEALKGQDDYKPEREQFFKRQRRQQRLRDELRSSQSSKAGALVSRDKTVDAMNSEAEAAVSASREEARATARAEQRARREALKRQDDYNPQQEKTFKRQQYIGQLAQPALDLFDSCEKQLVKLLSKARLENFFVTNGKEEGKKYLFENRTTGRVVVAVSVLAATYGLWRLYKYARLWHKHSALRRRERDLRKMNKPDFRQLRKLKSEMAKVEQEKQRMEKEAEKKVVAAAMTSEAGSVAEKGKRSRIERRLNAETKASLGAKKIRVKSMLDTFAAYKKHKMN